MKLAGLKKEYEATATTFTKKGMWPERYQAEVRGIKIAKEVDVFTPCIISSELNNFGGKVVMKYIYSPRLDQVLWGNPDPIIFKEVGATLAKIHKASIGEEISMRLANRRFRDLESDVLRRGQLPSYIINCASQIFKTICKKMGKHKPCFIHGDYTIQNMFYDESLIVFDWEHSCICSPIYDIGASLSFLILLVMDGGWSFVDYFNAIIYFLDGYKFNRLAKEDKRWITDALRFLGHRQIPQYYLFVLEYLAIVKDNQVCMSILKGDGQIEHTTQLLVDMGLNFDQMWLDKILRALQAGGYNFSIEFWNWCRREKLL